MQRLVTAVLLAATASWAQTIPVPSAYQDLYSTLTTQIASFDTAVKAGWNGSKYPVLYSPQLQSADSGQYTMLLGANFYSSTVLPELEEQKALGAQSVTVHISFPILYPPFYTANPSQYQQFVSFYQQLAGDIRSRGMKMVVESVTSTAFPGNQAASFTSYYQSLSWSAYMTGRAQNALNVAQLIQPDYMSVITEPDTEVTNTGQTTAGTVSGSTQLLQTILSTLQAAGPMSVSVGAGVGTWIDSFTQYVQSFATTSVQYIDLHIYPVNKNYFMNALTAAPIIQAAGKKIAITEAWDMKERNNELGILSTVQVYGRDPFSFWEPIDQAFLQALVDFGNAEKLTFIGPFWSHYFFAYLDYNTYGTLPSAQVLTSSDQAAAAANDVGAFSPTGLWWENAVLAAPDTSAPAKPSAPLATNVTPTIIQLSWLPTTDNVGVAAYNLFRNGTLLTTTNSLSYNDLGLTPGETYSYTLTAFDASGNVSAVSPPLSAETTDTTPPTVPTGLQAVAASSKSVALRWNASTGIGGVGGYRVLRGSSSTNMTIRANPTATSYTDSCQPGTTYYYAVESLNPINIASAASPAVSVTTPTKGTMK